MRATRSRVHGILAASALSMGPPAAAPSNAIDFCIGPWRGVQACLQ